MATTQIVCNTCGHDVGQTIYYVSNNLAVTCSNSANVLAPPVKFDMCGRCMHDKIYVRVDNCHECGLPMVDHGIVLNHYEYCRLCVENAAKNSVDLDREKKKTRNDETIHKMASLVHGVTRQELATLVNLFHIKKAPTSVAGLLRHILKDVQKKGGMVRRICTMNELE